MTTDPYLKLIEDPIFIYSAMRNFTDAEAYYDVLYYFTNNYDNEGINFYDFILLRFFSFAWRKCTVNSKTMDEASFECAVDIFYKSTLFE